MNERDLDRIAREGDQRDGMLVEILRLAQGAATKSEMRDVSARLDKVEDTLAEHRGRDGVVKAVLGVLGAGLVATWAWILMKVGGG